MIKDKRKGLVIKESLFCEILKDYELSRLIYFDKNGFASIDFEAYAKKGCYLPINGCYSKGWDFMKALNECKYRTQGGMIHLILMQRPTPILKKYKIPVYTPVTDWCGASAASEIAPDMPHLEIAVVEYNEANDE